MRLAEPDEGTLVASTGGVRMRVEEGGGDSGPPRAPKRSGIAPVAHDERHPSAQAAC